MTNLIIKPYISKTHISSLKNTYHQKKKKKSPKSSHSTNKAKDLGNLTNISVIYLTFRDKVIKHHNHDTVLHRSHN